MIDLSRADPRIIALLESNTLLSRWDGGLRLEIIANLTFADLTGNDPTGRLLTAIMALRLLLPDPKAFKGRPPIPPPLTAD